MSHPVRTLMQALLPDHLRDNRPDPSSPHRRRFTDSYRRKRELVKQLWMGAGLLVLLQPTVSTLVVVSLLMTFLAFTVLDETT